MSLPAASRRARAIVLGSGAGGGLPQWNCGCVHCEFARGGDARVEARSQAGLALSGDGTRWLLVNASPDLRAQLASCRALWPASGERDSPIGDVILTCGEIDAVAGLLTLREGHPFRLHATAPIQAVLSENPIFDVLKPDLVERLVLTPPSRMAAAGLSIELIAIPGKAPLYLEGRPDPGEGDAAGPIALLAAPAEGGGRALAYVPGCAAVTPELSALLGRADIVLMDGTVFHDDELIRAGFGTKTGRRMGHLPLAGEGGTLDLLAGLAPRRRILTHVNNTNPILYAGSPERREVEARGIEIAVDGMEIEL